MSRTSPGASLLAGILLAVLAGCGGAPTRDTGDLLHEADTAVGKADDNRVADYAAEELHDAHDKLHAAHAENQKARQDHSKQELRQAGWLAEEAKADADYASAKAAELRNQAVERELQRAVNSQSTQQNGGS